MASGPPASPARALAGVLATLERWGLRTLSDVARLSRAELHTRFGDLGVRLHQAACGEDAIPLVPADVAPRCVERLELEWPIEGLEPLSFVLARLSDALSAALARADRGAIVVTTRLALVTRACHERRLELPAPMRDARVLRTLILLDLEAHPPAAGIDVVEIECDVAPGRIVQGSLLARAWPSPETLSTLVARLSALMGETRIGAPLCVDTHDERRCAMGTFKILEKGEGQRAEGRGHRESSKAEGRSGLSIRRFRHPLAVRVTAERGVPVRVERRAGFGGGRVARVAGPWRTSGHWWMGDESAWDREAWDVTLADGGTYRLARDRRSTQWHIEGVFD